MPDPERCQYSADTGANLATMKRLFRHPQLLRLDVSIFMLHLMITAVFLCRSTELAGRWYRIGPAVAGLPAGGSAVFRCHDSVDHLG